MIDKVKSTIEKHNMLDAGATVVAAVSGGSDSMALLHVLNALKDEYAFNLCAAHVNHGIRGEAADSDELFVREKCKELGIKLYVKRADVKKLAAEQGIGLEECGRNVRYEFFNSLGENIVIATAHNLSDRAETFLFNFTRGASLRGLCSIPPVRENVIRPIIGCTKNEILDFCANNGIEYVTDASNADVKYSRNRIRHNVISQLCEINPSFEVCAGRCIESLNEDEAFLYSLAEEVVKNSVCRDGFLSEVLANAPEPIKKRAVVRIIEEHKGVTVESKFISSICDLLENGGRMQINGGITVRVRKGILDFPKLESEAPMMQELKDINFFGVARIETEIINSIEINNLQNISKFGLEYYLDCDKIHGRIIIRSREEGDKITLASRKCTKSLKKLFNEIAISPECRSSVAVFADESGVVLVEGAGVDSRVAVSKTSKKIMKIKIAR